MTTMTMAAVVPPSAPPAVCPSAGSASTCPPTVAPGSDEKPSQMIGWSAPTLVKLITWAEVEVAWWWASGRYGGWGSREARGRGWACSWLVGRSWGVGEVGRGLTPFSTTNSKGCDGSPISSVPSYLPPVPDEVIVIVVPAAMTYSGGDGGGGGGGGGDGGGGDGGGGGDRGHGGGDAGGVEVVMEVAVEVAMTMLLSLGAVSSDEVRQPSALPSRVAENEPAPCTY